MANICRNELVVTSEKSVLDALAREVTEGVFAEALHNNLPSASGLDLTLVRDPKRLRLYFETSEEPAVGPVLEWALRCRDTSVTYAHWPAPGSHACQGVILAQSLNPGSDDSPTSGHYPDLAEGEDGPGSDGQPARVPPAHGGSDESSDSGGESHDGLDGDDGRDDEEETLDADEWLVCSSCGTNCAKVGFRTAIERVKAFVQVTGPGSFEDDIFDTDCVALEHQELQCFRCHEEEYGDEWLAERGITDRADEPARLGS